MNLVWFFIPDSALVLVIVAIGFALMLGIIRGRQAASMLGGLIVMILLTPFVGALVDGLPLWVLALLMIMTSLSVLRWCSNLLLGASVTDHMLGSLAADAVKAGFWGIFFLLFLPLRVIGWLLRGGSR